MTVSESASARVQLDHVVGRLVPVRLTEWAEVDHLADTGAGLRELTLGDDPRVREEARELANSGVVTVTELRGGLRVETGSFVGRLTVGPLDITIVPKVAWSRWLRLFGYALRLRDLVRSPAITARVRPSSLHDLVVLELVMESRDLLARGLHREYERLRRPLAAPRGRIDFSQIARAGSLREARVPCRFTRRETDTLLNQALLAGLRTATRIATDPGLRADARHLAQGLCAAVSGVPLTADLLRRTWKSVDRRTARYSSALRLAELLRAGAAVALDGDDEGDALAIRGFALDMNALWQRFLGRVLSEWAPGVKVREELALQHLFRSDPAFAPRPRRLRSARPDFAVLSPGKPVRYLDAKYRDLWTQGLPRDMLYQLALYAAAQEWGAAAMLYPTEAVEAAEERLDVCNPVDGRPGASVALRPVHLQRLEELVAEPASPRREAERQAFARALLGVV